LHKLLRRDRAPLAAFCRDVGPHRVCSVPVRMFFKIS
jgi:hypothetical protein